MGNLPPELAERIRHLPEHQRTAALELAQRLYGEALASTGADLGVAGDVTGDVAHASDPDTFLDHATYAAPNARTPSERLYDAYTSWCRERGQEPKTKTAFGKRLNARSIPQARDGRRRYRLGIAIRAAEEAPPPPAVADAPVPRRRSDGAPGHLSEDAARWWLDVKAEIPELEQHDEMLLTLLAETWDLKEQARRQLSGRPQLCYTNANGNQVPFPEALLYDKYTRLWAFLRREFGFDLAEPDPARPGGELELAEV